jgi:hypothetical protein
MLNARYCFIERGHIDEQHPAVQVWDDPMGQSAMQCRPLGCADLNPPITNAFHLLDLPAERLAVKIGQCDRVLAVDFKMKLLKGCVTATGCEHFGILVGQRTTIASVGLVGRLMQNA